MNILTDNIRDKLTGKGLKVTPQRLAILEAVYNLNNHPTAENIIEYIHQYQPNIATGTVYKVLDTLVEHKLIKKVKTDCDIMRYDGIIEPHHHLYCSGSDVIEDYMDPDLDGLLKGYFSSKQISGFKIEEIVLQIRGTFDKR
jgi:Fur family peroxide stress response transcriptional regulator